MENDDNKKESKGKRALKKGLRRGSRASSSNGNSARPRDRERTDTLTITKNHQDKKSVAIKGKINEVERCHGAVLQTVFVEETSAAPVVSSSKEGTSKKPLKRKLEEERSAAAAAGTSGASTDTDPDDKDPNKDKKKKNRCGVCRKKVGLTGFECRCGGLFCALHRYSDKHECSFDYRELGAQEIRRNNPVVVSQKIHKI